MSRERPIEPPRALPDHVRGKKLEKPQHRRQREHIEQLKSVQGPGFFASFFNPYDRPGMREPQFLRRGYEASIVDGLCDFFRLRPWRPKNRRSLRTRKEQQKLLRRMEHAGQIRRCGGGRFELTRVSPHA